MKVQGWTCPECVQGKHGNCDGTAWDDERDCLTICSCMDVICVGADG